MIRRVRAAAGHDILVELDDDLRRTDGQNAAIGRGSGDHRWRNLPDLVYEDVHHAVRICADQVAGIRGEGDPVAAGRNGGIERAAICLAAGGIDRNAPRLAGLQVVDEDICNSIGIAADQVAGVGIKGYITPTSAESAGLYEESLPWSPDEATETRRVCPVWRSWTKMSETPFVSPLTRLSASDWNAT